MAGAGFAEPPLMGTYNVAGAGFAEGYYGHFILGGAHGVAGPVLRPSFESSYGYHRPCFETATMATSYLKGLTAWQAQFRNKKYGQFILGGAEGVAGPVLKQELWPLHTWRGSRRGRPSFETKSMASSYLERLKAWQAQF